jgi:hypothetical protein
MCGGCRSDALPAFFVWIASASPPGDEVRQQNRSRHCEAKAEAIQERNTSLRGESRSNPGIAMMQRGFSLDCRAAIAARNDVVGAQSRSRHPERFARNRTETQSLCNIFVM